jgi:uncharacterized integral membrane protein
LEVLIATIISTIIFLMMEAVGTSETSADFYQGTPHNITAVIVILAAARA